MNKKEWVWLLIATILIIVSFRIEKSIYKDFPSSYEIIPFDLIEQPDGISCGPTSIQMVLKRYEYNHSLQEIRKTTKTDLYVKGDLQIGGTTPEYIEIALETFGVNSSLMVGDLDSLKWHISKNRPPIVLVRSGQKIWHYAVAIGYNEDSIILADPGCGKKITLSTKTFIEAWQFIGDLHGRDVSIKCWLCKGKGNYYEPLGVLGKCDICGGNGKIPDWLWLLVELGEAKGCMMVIPKEAFKQKKG